MRLGFALEYSLGHATHAENLKTSLRDDPGVDPLYVDLPYNGTLGPWSRLPGVRSNWSLRASLAAYLALRAHHRRLNAALFHTQVTSLLSPGLMRSLPSVVSLDATPLQIDSMGAAYGHIPSGSPRVEAMKKRLNERAFEACRHLITWSQWTKNSLVADYGIGPEKVTVIPPGIDVERWRFDRQERPRDAVINLLFVGGCFERKGGDTMLSALSMLPPHVRTHLHVVTRAANAGDGRPDVTVHRGVTSNSDTLLKLYADADVFVFPTRGDCLGLAVLEAMAAGLPVITTDVGAMSEAVSHGETGLLVPVDDPTALADAIAGLAQDPGLRSRLGAAAREAAVARFSGKTNYRRVAETLKRYA